jgi:predicted PP-loop superfamily ATPase
MKKKPKDKKISIQTVLREVLERYLFDELDLFQED